MNGRREQRELLRLMRLADELGKRRNQIHAVLVLCDQAPELCDDELRARLVALAERLRA